MADIFKPHSNQPARPKLDFDVMPTGQKTTSRVNSRPVPSGPIMQEVDVKRNGWKKIMVIVLLLLVLAAGVYLVFSRFTGEKEVSEDQKESLERVLVDGDGDGVEDSEERVLGTSVADADTDSDGLSDGDEVNVYGSNPLLFDTDSDGYEDGQEPALGFSPVVATTSEAAVAEQEKWSRAIEQYGLHEPTLTVFQLHRSANLVAPEANKTIAGFLPGTASPAGIHINEKSVIKLIISPEPNTESTAYVELEKFIPNLNIWRKTIQLNDQGVLGDTIPNDGQYGAQIQLFETKTGEMKFRFKGRTTKKDVFSEEITVFIFDKEVPIGPSRKVGPVIIHPTLGQVIADQVVVGLVPGTKVERIMEIVAQIDGSLEGNILELNIWEIGLEKDSTGANIVRAMERLEIFPEVDFAEPSSLRQLDFGQ